MKVAERNSDVTTQGVQSSISYTIETKNLPGILGVLRSQLYSNKPLALFREYSCNAHDSHVANGTPEKPIQITMPTPFDMTLKIRDFGTGLDENDLTRIFSSYGESTKRDSNEQIGQLGLGSKSAFCYANEFTITSFYNGVKTIFSSYIDESNVGKIDKLGASQPTDEENGIEIAIRVKQGDIDIFNKTAKTFFKTFHPRPIILGSTEVADYLKNVKNEIVLTGSNWIIQENENSYNPQILISMGNIVYPFELKLLDMDDVRQKWVAPLRYKDLILKVRIGDVQFVANREALEYNDKTNNFVRDQIRTIYTELKSDIEKEIATAPNIWTARQLLAKRNNVVGHINFKPCFNNVTIESFNVPDAVVKSLGIKVVQYQEHNRMFKEGYLIHPVKDPTLFLFRKDYSESGGRAKARQYMASNGVKGEYCYIISGDNAQIDAVIASDEFKGAKMVELNTIKLISTYVSKKANKDAVDRAKASIFKWTGGTLRPYSQNWEVGTVGLTDNIVYVKIKMFKPTFESCGFSELQTLKEVCGPYFNLTGQNLEIYGVREDMVLGANWVSLKDHLKTQVLLWAQDKDITAAREHQIIERAMQDHLQVIATNHKEVLGNGDLRKLMDTYALIKSAEPVQAVNTKWSNLFSLSTKINLGLEAVATDFITLYETVIKKYRLLKLFENNYYQSAKVKDYLPELKAYIDLVDRGMI